MTAARDIDVFVSYSASDRERVRPFVDTLQAAGLAVWWDARITPGAGFDTEIQRALEDAKCVLVVWSQTSVTSEWVITEADEGLVRGTLVPIRIDDVRPPLAFRRRQTIPADGSVSSQANVVAAVRAVLDGKPFEGRSLPKRASGFHVLWTCLAFALGLGVGLLGYVTWLAEAQPSVSQSPMRASLPMDGWEDWQFSDPASSMVMSRDGKLIVYVARDDTADTSLRVRYLDQVATSRIGGTEGAERPFLSPDGRWIGYFDGNAIKRISLTGGEAITVARLSPKGCCRSASWGDDGRIVFNEGTSGLNTVLLDDPTHQILTQPDLSRGEESHRTPHYVKGHSVLLFSVYVASENKHEVWALDLKTRERRYLLDGLRPMFLDSGYLIYTKGESLLRGSIWAVAFDPESMTTAGSPSLLQSAVAGREGSAYSLSGDGKLLYMPDHGELVGELAFVGMDGSSRTLSHGDRFEAPRFSSDGRAVAVSAFSEAGVPTIRIYRIDTGARRDFAQGLVPLWSPDDESITYNDFGVGLVRQRLDGTTKPQTLVSHPWAGAPQSWLDDGTKLLYTLSGPAKPGDLYILSPDGESRHLAGNGATVSSITGDGRWIAICMWPQGIVVGQLPSLTHTTLVSESGCHPKWSRDGKRLYYTVLNKVVAADVKLEDSVNFGAPEVVADAGVSGRGFIFDVDGQGNLIIARHRYSEPKLPVVMTGWESQLP